MGHWTKSAGGVQNKLAARELGNRGTPNNSSSLQNIATGGKEQMYEWLLMFCLGNRLHSLFTDLSFDFRSS